MRLFTSLVLLFIINNTFSQDLGGRLKLLTYIKGCHGSCNYSYADFSKIENCGVEKDSIIEIINVFKVNGELYINGKLITKQKADTLESFLKNKSVQIMKLITDVSIENNAQFIPPRATCFEFEEFQIYKEKSLISCIILNEAKNENGSFLREEDIELFKTLKKIIK